MEQCGAECRVLAEECVEGARFLLADAAIEVGGDEVFFPGVHISRRIG
jgi:hypothetical protein